MKKETLKSMIETEFERCDTISSFKKEVFRLIDLCVFEGDDNKIIESSQKDGNKNMETSIIINGKPFVVEIENPQKVVIKNGLSVDDVLFFKRWQDEQENNYATKYKRDNIYYTNVIESGYLKGCFPAIDLISKNITIHYDCKEIEK